MSAPRALITGIAGQDGSYLAEQLLEEGYEVHGMLRRQSTPEHQDTRIQHLEDRITTYYGDLSDAVAIRRILKAAQPDEIYNLAAQSHVRIGFDVPLLTLETNAVGVFNIIEAYRDICPTARFYQASSSEMFGNSVDADGRQRETTPMHPASPYGCAKLYAYSLVRHYRRAYGLFTCNGILFNHESPRRGSNFVTGKICKTASLIKKGRARELLLGNLDAERDWGHSKDYVRAMRLILRHAEPDDFVVATGETRSVRQLCQVVFAALDLDYRDYVRQDARNLRAEELHSLRGDATRVRHVLGWKPEYTFEAMIAEMVAYWLERT